MTSARRNAVAAAGIVIAAVALHARALGYGFVNWDDDRFITGNPLFAAGGWTYVRAALTRVQFEAYHPLHLLSYLPDRWLWPRRAAGFHAASLALFALDVSLLFRLARRHACLAGAAAATLLFAAHPLCVEPVAWITGRKDLLAACFFVGVLLIEDRRAPDDARPSLAGLALFAAALLAKTSTLCLPLVVWCWRRWMRGTTARAAARRALPYALVALGPTIAVMTIWRQHQMLGPRPVPAPIDVLATLATYARRIAWPSDLAAVYPPEMPAATVAAALAAALAVAVLLRWRRLPPPARFALAAFPAALLPVANIVPINLRFADRYAFLALGLLVPPGAAGLQALFRGGERARAAAIAAVAAAAISLAAITVPLTATWASARALWARATAAHPDAVMARIKYGETLVALRDYEGARNEYQVAVRMLPQNAFGYGGLLFLYASQAEDQGRVPPGTARKWLAAFNAAQMTSTAFDAFMATVSRAACPACANTLLLMRLRRWPAPDDLLRRAARAALDEREPDAALVILDAAADKNAPGWGALAAEAKRAAERPR